MGTLVELFSFSSYLNFRYNVLINGQLEKVVSWLMKKISSKGLAKKMKFRLNYYIDDKYFI